MSDHRLVELYPRPDESRGIDVIFVDGFEGVEPDLPFSDWAKPLHGMVPENMTPRIIHLNLGIVIRKRLEKFPGALKQAQQVLLDELYEFYERKDSPIVFFGYRLAGISLKQALCTARDNAEQRPEARRLVSNTFGVILIGTPHLEDDVAVLVKTISIMVRGKSISTSKQDKFDDVRHAISMIGHDFDRQQFLFRSLSFIETQKTKYGRPKLHLGGHREKRVLVNENLGKTALYNGRPVDIKGKLCDFFNNNKDKITQFFGDVSKDIRVRVNEDEALQHQTGKDIVQSDYGTTEGSSGGKGPLSWLGRMGLRRMRHLHPRHTSTQSPIADVPCYYQFPQPRPTKLFGREEILKQIHDALWNNSPPEPVNKQLATGPSRLRAFMLSGKPGMGKTEIAREYVVRHKKDYNAIAWLVADTKANLEQKYAEFASKLNIIPPKQTDLTVSRFVLYEWLSSPIYIEASEPKVPAKWLLVMDDAKASDFMLDLWPREAQGAILVLGRDPDLRSGTFLDIDGHDLEALPEEDAARLFQSVARKDFSPPIEQDVLEIVRNWSCIPAAIIRVATKFRDHRQSLADFKDDQASHRAELLREGVSNLTSIAAMWALEGRGDSERVFLSVLSFLHHTRIPEELLTQNWTKADLPHYPDGSEYENCCNTLKHDRLVEYDKVEKLLSIERVLQDGIQAIYLRSPANLASTFNATVRLLSSIWPKSITVEVHFSLLDVGTRWNLCEKLLPHVDRIAERYQTFGEEIQRSCATRELASLLIEASWYRRERGLDFHAIALLDAASMTLEHASDDMLDLLSAMHNTGGAISLSHNQKEVGLERYEQFKKVQERIFAESGIETTKYAAAYSELGIAHIMNEHASEEVLQLFKKSEEIRRRLPGFEKLNLFNTLRGKAYFHLLHGDLEKSSANLLEALKDREDKFGVDDQRGGRSAALLFDLGNITYRQSAQATGEDKAKKLADSIGYYNRALTIFLAVYGEHDVRIADVHVVIARHILANCQETELERAEVLLETATNIYSRTSFFLREIARALFFLSHVLRRMNRQEEGLARLEEAKVIRDKLDPTNQISLKDLKVDYFDKLVVILKR